MIIYLASPYSHEDEVIKRYRFDRVCKKASELMEQGNIVFCPIAHSHSIDAWYKEPQSGEFWKKQDLAILRHCSKLIIYKLDGWENSEGIRWETQAAYELNIPVEYI